MGCKYRRNNKRMKLTVKLSLCVLFVILQSAQGTLPMLNSTGHESLRDYRRRLNIDFKYQTRHMNPEFCRTISEEDCQRIDETQGKYHERNRNWMKRQMQATGASAIMETTGTLNVLVLLMEWSNHAQEGRQLIDRDDIEALFNSDGFDDLPTGSIKRYFETSSYDRFTIQATVVDWVTTDNTEAFYSSPNSGRTEAIYPAFIPVLENAENQGIDFSLFHRISNGNDQREIDLVVFLHSGYEATLGEEDCNNGAPSNLRIAAHARSGPTVDWQSSTGYTVGGYALASAFRGRCNSNIARHGIITHEMFHPFGLPDLYDVGVSPDDPLPAGQLGGIANYDIMVRNATAYEHFS